MSSLVTAGTLAPPSAAAAAAAEPLHRMPLPAGKDAPLGRSSSLLPPSSSMAMAFTPSHAEPGSLLGLLPLSPGGLPGSGRPLLASASASGSLSSSWLELGSVYDSRVASDFLLLEEEEDDLGLGGCCPRPGGGLLDALASPPGLTPLGPPTAAPAAAGQPQETAADGLASFLAEPASSDGTPSADLDALLPSEALTPAQGGAPEPYQPHSMPDLLLGTASGNEGSPQDDLAAQGSNSPGLLPSRTCPLPLRGGPSGDSSSPWCLLIPSGPSATPPGSGHTSSSPRLALTPTSPAPTAAGGAGGGTLGSPRGQHGSPGGQEGSSSTTPQLYRLVRVDDATGAPLREATVDEAQELSQALAAEGGATTPPAAGKGACGSSGRKAGVSSGGGGGTSSSSSRAERDNEWGDDLDVPCARPPRPFHHKGGGPCDHCGVMESPQWRRGPPAKPILCNACGTRYRRTAALGPAQRTNGVTAAHAASSTPSSAPGGSRTSSGAGAGAGSASGRPPLSKPSSGSKRGSSSSLGGSKSARRS